MLIPKASHLVERVAERLLWSGSLDQSTTQLLQPSQTPPTETAADGEEPGPEAARRSSLFSPLEPPPAAAWHASPAAPSHAVPGPPAGSPPLTQDEPVAFAPVALDTDGGALRPVAEPPPIAAPADRLAAAAASPGPASPSGAPLRPYAPPPPFQPAPFAPASTFASAAPLSRDREPGADAAAGDLPASPSIDAVSLERAGMVDWSRTRSRISEEFRLVQRQILRSAFGPGAEPGFSNLLMVTSARPGEGKSFMSINMAGSIARQGDNHVLLIDADSKRDSVCYSLGLAQSRGLLDLAANPKLEPSPLIVRSPIERLSVLPVGRERERSAELFSTKEMTRLIQSLGRRYADRLLILDAPPCLSTSDPAVLAQVVGQILFVVEADRTQRDEVEASLDLIQACPTITLVLNKQQISSRYTFGAYSSYYSS